MSRAFISINSTSLIASLYYFAVFLFFMYIYFLSSLIIIFNVTRNIEVASRFTASFINIFSQVLNHDNASCFVHLFKFFFGNGIHHMHLQENYLLASPFTLFLHTPSATRLREETKGEDWGHRRGESHLPLLISLPHSLPVLLPPSLALHALQTACRLALPFSSSYFYHYLLLIQFL